MRTAVVAAIIVVVFAILGLLGYYFGTNVHKMLIFRGITPRRAVFWAVFAIAFTVIFVASAYFRSALLATMLYSLILFGLGDILRLAARIFGWQAGLRALDTVFQGGLTLLIIALGITVFAWFNAHNPVLKSYQLVLDKDFGALESIKIVMLSDLHLGTVTDEAGLRKLVQNVNAQSPDIICLCGDIFDEGTSERLRVAAFEAFAGLNARYGIYYITGNHDSEVSLDDMNDWQAAGVTPLLNECVLVADSFYIAGLSDSGHSGESQRGAPGDVLTIADRSKPVILLDHRPGGLQDSAEAGVDLQLSGHTHAGQLFPFNFLSDYVNKVGYGHETYGDFHIIVSSGYGVWGMPARLGSACEYVCITLIPQGSEG